MGKIDTSNLTGGQIQEVMDFLIYKGLEPIVRYSAVFDIQIVHLIGIAATNKKRKISALDREEFLTKLCNALATNNGDTKMSLISSAKIERGFVYNFLVNFINETANYVDLYTRYLTCSAYIERQTLDKQLQAIERTVGFSRDHLFSAISNCVGYVDLFYRFRNTIVEQYIRHAYKQAHGFVKSKVTSDNYDLKDLHQSLMAAITKAIDKYDSSQGALTSYINYWILNAQTYSNQNYGHEYGIAYTIPQLQKKQVQGTKASHSNFSVSLDSTVGAEDEEVKLKNILVGDPGVDQTLEEQDEQNTILYLIKCADRQGIARLYLDISEYFSKKEQVRMLKTMKRQLGYLPKVDESLIRQMQNTGIKINVDQQQNCKPLVVVS